MRTILIVLLAACLFACGEDDECDPGEMRCNGDAVEMCGSDWTITDTCLGSESCHYDGTFAHCLPGVPDIRY